MSTSIIRVLYVEDEPFLGKIVKESLESRQFEVHWIMDGADVLAAFEQVRPNICVLDVMLPNRDGFALGRDLRARDPQVPIIFLTAKNQTQDVLQGFESGGNDYLRKPFSQEELIVRIKNLVALTRGASMPSPPATEGVRLGRYRFFPDRQELQLDGGQAVRQLSHRETQLLDILTAKPNAVAERKFILQQVWGHDSIFNSRNLDVYIAHLREYLKDDPTVQILTLKSVGYRVVC
jgi:DNA-binding response OmpR family regulator